MCVGVDCVWEWIVCACGGMHSFPCGCHETISLTMLCSVCRSPLDQVHPPYLQSGDEMLLWLPWLRAFSREQF